MANKEYLEMLHYGEWLEKFLDKNIKSWRLQELLEEAVNTLKIEGLDKEVFQVDAFKNLENVERFLERHDIKGDHKESPEAPVFESEGRDQPVEEGEVIILPQNKSPELRLLGDFLSIRGKTIGLLKEVLKTNRPWEHVFSLNRLNRNYPIDSLLESYNGLVERSYLENNKFKKKAELIPKTPIDLWMTVFSRILIDFLKLGGQEYYGFCDYCDNFYLVQRKGKRKYCGDNCKALFHKYKKPH
jgi:hypothetical protein